MGPGSGVASAWYSSGTSLVPSTTPMDMLSFRQRGWSLLLSGVLFGIYSDQTGPRGRDKLFSTDWFMPMASHHLGPGTVTFRSMLSLEQLTISQQRYPLLFQTGETAHGVPIINGQHPHDLFMELAVAWNVRLGSRGALNLYAGPRGEPALGPPAFPHRTSNSENAMAVLAHHHQDSTHISTSVVTAGLSFGPVTWEVSGFHGREPDEKRWGIEGGAIDSLSTRLTVIPASRWAAQYSIGRINNREVTHPLRDTLRTTASISYVRPLERGHWSTTMVWGRDNDLAYTALPGVPPLPLSKSFGTASLRRPLHIVSVPTRVPSEIYNSFLAESTLRFRNRNWIWGRAESVDKDSSLLYEETPLVLLIDERRFARVQAYTAGYERELPAWGRWVSPALGAQLTVFHAPASLEPVYGSSPVGVQLFMRFRMGQSPR